MPAVSHHGGVRDGSCGANRGSATDGGARRLRPRGCAVYRAEPVCGTGSSPRGAERYLAALQEIADDGTMTRFTWRSGRS